MKLKPALIFPNDHNPRFIKDANFQRLVQSIKTFPKMLDVRPIIIDEKSMILGGNMRYRACVEAGLPEIPVLIAEGWTEDEKKEFIIKDNLGYGEWDWEIMANEWNQEQLEDWGLDLPMDFNLEENADEDDYIMPGTIKTNLEIGDLITIGPHRLLCGDSTDPDQVGRLMDGKEGALVFTDPPYGVSYTGVDNGEGTKWEMIDNDDLRGNGLYLFLLHSFKNLFKHTRNDIALYCWHASRNHMEFETALNEAGFEVKQQLIWNKGMILGRSDYHWAHEPMLYCKKKDQKTPWHGDRKSKTILKERRTELTKLKKDDLLAIITALLDDSSCWEIDRDKVKEYQHPTQKPVTLAGKALINSSKKGEIVIDAFLGSGSTMVASHQLGRVCYGMELDPKYCQVIMDRMINLDPTLEVDIKKPLTFIPQKATTK